MAYSVVESLASGTPVVATPIPGHTLVGRNVEALRIKGHDHASLAAGVIETLGRSEAQAAIQAAQAREWISENLSLEGNASRLLNLYEEAIAGRGVSVPFTFQHEWGFTGSHAERPATEVERIRVCLEPQAAKLPEASSGP